MSKSLNKVSLIGYIGNYPDIKFTNNECTIANLSIATSESWTDKQSGAKQERTEWHKVIFFNKLAEICGEYVVKGMRVYVEGKLRTRKWDDKDGVTRYSTEILGDQLIMLSNNDTIKSKKTDENQNGKKEKSDVYDDAGKPEFDDDIPF